MHNREEGRRIGERIDDSQIAEMEAGRTSGEAPAPPPVPISQSITPSGTTVGGSRAGTPISGWSAPETTTLAPPTRRIRLDWDLDLLSLPQQQNNDVNAKVRLVAARHFKIWDQWKEQPTEKKQECINELRAFYKGTDAIPDSFFRDKFSAWGRNRRHT
ncbi:hypothetical protein R1sor_004429 [Riccia sorocarpa]|uniref:Uncharacterized protein n=1 Tax=Riccia sorocarpa TaxID=122646 RepID=A0ABD3HHB4_9MARC